MKLSAFLVVCCSATTAFALPDYEPFADATASAGTAYLVNDPLIGQKDAQGQSWAQAGPNQPSPQPTISAGNLSVSGLADPQGNSVSFGGNGTSARFGLGSSITSGTIYYSFAFKLTDITALSTSGVFWAGFNNSTGSQTTTPTTVGSRVVAKASGTSFQIGLDKSSGTASLFAFDPTLYNVNDVIFVVGSYTFNTGTTTDDVSKLWINPSSSSFGGSEPAGALTSTAGTDLGSIPSFVLFERSTAEPAGIIADELRFGTSYADVTPVPEPASSFCIGLGVLGLVAWQYLRKR